LAYLKRFPAKICANVSIGTHAQSNVAKRLWCRGITLLQMHCDSLQSNFISTVACKCGKRELILIVLSFWAFADELHG